MIATFVVSIAFSNCKKEDAIKPSCNNNSPSFAVDVVPILTTYCTNDNYGSCHQSGNTNDFTIYENFKFKVDGGHVQEHVIEHREMPPPYTLGPKKVTEAELHTLRCWIEHGAQDN